MAEGGYSVGSAYLSIVPSFKGMVRAVEQEAQIDAKAYAATFRAELDRQLRGLDVGPSDAESLKRGTTAGKRYAEGFGARVQADPADMRVDLDTKAADAKLAALRAEINGGSGASGPGLIGGLLALSPAAVPIIGALTGALGGLIPTLATTALGIKGISDELKDGSLVGTKYAADLGSVTSELSSLERIAAGGLLRGIDTALGSAHQLWPEVNDDVQLMSGYLGEIVGGAGPALVRILTQANPLFVAFGRAVADGAQHLEDWAEHSDGISRFVAYVQAELPDVLRLGGELVTLFGHLVQGAAPFGGVLLRDLTLFIGALDAIPVSVLQVAVPAAVALYAAFKSYTLITAGVRGAAAAVEALGTAFGLTGPRAAASAAAQEAASLQVQAAAAEEAAAVAASRAEEADATAAASVEIAASLEGTSSVLAGEATAAAEASIEFAAAMRAEATAAATSATDIAAAADAAATASTEAGETAALGWSSMLGPIGAVVVGGGLLATMFLHSGSSAAAAAQQVDTYTQAIKADSGALGENTRQAAVNALQKAGALDAARKLGISLSLATDAALGNASAADKISAALGQYTDKAADARAHGIDVAHANDTMSKSFMANRDAAKTLLGTLQDQDGEVRTSVQNYKDQQAAMGNTTTATNTQKTAVQQLTNAYKDLTGQLSAAEAATAFNQQLLTLTGTLKDNKSAISSRTAAGLADQQQIEATISALQQKDKIDTTNATTIAATTAAYRTDAQAILDHIAKVDGDATASERAKDKAYQFAQQLLGLSKITAAPEINDASVRAAIANVRALANAIASLPSSTQIKVGHREYATGGYITGPGTSTSDSILTRVSAGEYVVNAAQTARYRPLLDAINYRAPGYATGGYVHSPIASISQISASLTRTQTPVSGQPIVIPVYLDSREIARGVAPAIAREAQLHGVRRR